MALYKNRFGKVFSLDPKKKYVKAWIKDEQMVALTPEEIKKHVEKRKAKKSEKPTKKKVEKAKELTAKEKLQKEYFVATGELADSSWTMATLKEKLAENVAPL